jgi:phosphopantetheine--protein transferase-like protein
MTVGIDILERTRIVRLLKQHKTRFVKKIFTKRESDGLRRKRDIYYALGFSFKEAFWKSLPPRIQKKAWFNDIEILWKDNVPQVYLFGRKIDGLVLKYNFDRDFVITAVINSRNRPKQRGYDDRERTISQEY